MTTAKPPSHLSDSQGLSNHLRTFESNNLLSPTATLATEHSDTQQFHNATKVFDTPGKQTKPYSFIPGGANSTQHVKRLANLLDLRDNMPRSNSRSTLMDTFNIASVHSPSHSSNPNKSIRQKISTMKPVTPTHALPIEDSAVVKPKEFAKLAMSRILRDTNTSKREATRVLYKTSSDAQLRAGQQSTSQDNREQKIKQISTVYRDQSVLDHLRLSRSNLNTSANRTGTYSHSPNNSQINIPYSFTQPSKPSNPSSSTNILSNFTPNTSMLNLITDVFAENPKPPTDAKSGGNHKRGQSYTQSLALDKDMLLAKQSKRIITSKCSDKNAHNNANNSINSSFHSLARDFNLNSKNMNISMERLNGMPNSSAGWNNNGQHNNNNLSTNNTIVINNINPSMAWGDNTQQSHLGRGEQIESKIEILLTNKATEPQHMEEINALFDVFIDSLGESGYAKENQKTRSMLRKIKLAYEIFFQNFSHHESRKFAKAQDTCNHLKHDYETLESKFGEMTSELETLRKENARLMQIGTVPVPHSVTQGGHAKVPRLSLSPSNSIATVHKHPHIDSEETPPATKNSAGFTQMNERESLKSVIVEQQNTISSLKKKEAKMIRLLYACKKKGLDIEQIYHEDVKHSVDCSGPEEESIPTINKGAKHQPNYHHPEEEEPQQQQMYPPGTQSSSRYPEEPDEIQSQSALGSGKSSIHLSMTNRHPIEEEKSSSDFDHYEVHAQPAPQEKGLYSLHPAIKNKLKLDFSQLNRPKPTKISEPVPMEFIIHDQKPSVQKEKSPVNNGFKKKLPPPLFLNNIREEEENSIGFHEEFMSKIDEFSVSWRQAAAQERKIP